MKIIIQLSIQEPFCSNLLLQISDMTKKQEKSIGYNNWLQTEKRVYLIKLYRERLANCTYFCKPIEGAK